MKEKSPEIKVEDDVYIDLTDSAIQMAGERETASTNAINIEANPA